MAEKEVFGTTGYAKQAAVLFEQYEKFDIADSLGSVVKFFPDQPSKILDIGSGTGSLAAWFASRGHCVLAAEPVEQFREPARLKHPENNICFIDDSLPDLAKILERDELYNLITLNAVWMHLDKERREIGMSNIASLLECRGRVFISLRHGPVPASRKMFNVTAAETIELASRNNLHSIHTSTNESIQEENRRNGVTWTKLVFEFRG